MDRPSRLIAVGIIVLLALSAGAALASASTSEATRTAAPVSAVHVRADLTQLDGYQLRQVSLPNFAYLYPYLYNYRLQYPVMDFASPCLNGLLYITNASRLNCYTVANATSWVVSPPLTLLYQRTTGIQSQIDNEFQLDTPYDVALLYGNLSGAAGPVTIETVNLTTGVLKEATTPVPMANSIQCDYVGANTVVTWNQSGTNGGPEFTNLSNGTSWRSGLAVGVAPNNVYWVSQLNAFIDVAGNHVAELKVNAARTSITNVGNAWLNRTGLSSITAVNGVQYRASTGQISILEATNLGAEMGVVKLTGGVLKPSGAYTYLSSYQPYIQRYAYTSPLLWSLKGSTTVLFDPLTNATQTVPNLVTRTNSSGGNQNYEWTNPYTTSVYLSINTTLTGNATRAPNQFVYASSPLAVHVRPWLISNTVAWPTGAYQQKAVINSALDATWEAANLTNVFWTYASNSTSIPAWLQNGSTSGSSSTVWYLSLASIAGHGSVVVDEDFAATTATTFGKAAQTGEAPSLTSTYGAYDNGAVVFPMYDNFIGTSLNTHIWTASFASGSATVNNGLTTTSVQTGHGSRPACGLVANYNNLTGSFEQQAQVSSGGMGDSKQVGLFTTLTKATANCATNYQVVSEADWSATDYEPSNIYGVFSQSAAGNNYNVNTVGLTYKRTAPYLLGLDQANDSAHHYANTSTNDSPLNSAGQRFGNLIPSSPLYGGIALWAGAAVTVGNLSWWRETAEVATMPTVAGVPPAPTGLTVGTPTAHSLKLTWVNPSGTVTNDTVFRWLNVGCFGSPLASPNSTGSAVTTFTVGGLAINTSYSYEVTASNSTGTGAPSACAAGTTLGVPLPPTGLLAVAENATNVTLRWVVIGTTVNETVFIWVGVVCVGNVTHVNSTGGARTNFTVGNLTQGTTYSFKVSATNATGASHPSACVQATTVATGWTLAQTQGFDLVLFGLVGALILIPVAIIAERKSR